MSRRYAYTYTEAELKRRRLIGAIVGLPVWWVLASFLVAPVVGGYNVLTLVLSGVVSLGIVYLTWRFNTRQFSKFQRMD